MQYIVLLSLIQNTQTFMFYGSMTSLQNPFRSLVVTSFLTALIIQIQMVILNFVLGSNTFTGITGLLKKTIHTTYVVRLSYFPCYGGMYSGRVEHILLHVLISPLVMLPVL